MTEEIQPLPQTLNEPTPHWHRLHRSRPQALYLIFDSSEWSSVRQARIFRDFLWWWRWWGSMNKMRLDSRCTKRQNVPRMQNTQIKLIKEPTWASMQANSSIRVSISLRTPLSINLFWLAVSWSTSLWSRRFLLDVSTFIAGRYRTGGSLPQHFHEYAHCHQ